MPAFKVKTAEGIDIKDIVKQIRSAKLKKPRIGDTFTEDVLGELEGAKSVSLSSDICFETKNYWLSVVLGETQCITLRFKSIGKSHQRIFI